jgi:hypothetical protein
MSSCTMFRLAKPSDNPAVSSSAVQLSNNVKFKTVSTEFLFWRFKDFVPVLVPSFSRIGTRYLSTSVSVFSVAVSALIAG